MSEPADDESVPRLPRGHGLKLDSAMMFRIAMTLALLVMIVVTARPCANATSKFVTDFGDEGSGAGSAKAMPMPGNVDLPKEPKLEDYEVLRPDMTEEEQRAVIERAKAKAKAAAASDAGSAAGSATAPAAGSATAPAAGSASADSGSGSGATVR